MQLPASALLRGSTVVGDGQRVAQQFPHMAIVETVISRAMSHPNVVQVRLPPPSKKRPYCLGLICIVMAVSIAAVPWTASILSMQQVGAAPPSRSPAGHGRWQMTVKYHPAVLG
jgi:hypothetical protein